MVRSCRFRHIMTGPTGAKLTTISEFVAPDRTHSIQEETGMETMTVGGKFYIKNGSKWEQSNVLSIENKYIRNFQNESEFEEYYREISKIMKGLKAVGPNTVDGTPVMIYQYTNSIGKEVMESQLWIGVRDNILYKIESSMKSNNNDKDLNFDLKDEMYFYDFDADIKIEPPI